MFYLLDRFQNNSSPTRLWIHLNSFRAEKWELVSLAAKFYFQSNLILVKKHSRRSLIHSGVIDWTIIFPRSFIFFIFLNSIWSLKHSKQGSSLRVKLFIVTGDDSFWSVLMKWYWKLQARSKEGSSTWFWSTWFLEMHP